MGWEGVSCEASLAHAMRRGSLRIWPGVYLDGSCLECIQVVLVQLPVLHGGLGVTQAINVGAHLHATGDLFLAPGGWE